MVWIKSTNALDLLMNVRIKYDCFLWCPESSILWASFVKITDDFFFGRSVLKSRHFIRMWANISRLFTKYCILSTKIFENKNHPYFWKCKMVNSGIDVSKMKSNSFFCAHQGYWFNWTVLTDFWYLIKSSTQTCEQRSHIRTEFHYTRINMCDACRLCTSHTKVLGHHLCTAISPQVGIDSGASSEKCCDWSARGQSSLSPTCWLCRAQMITRSFFVQWYLQSFILI